MNDDEPSQKKVMDIIKEIKNQNSRMYCMNKIFHTKQRMSLNQKQIRNH